MITPFSSIIGLKGRNKNMVDFLGKDSGDISRESSDIEEEIIFSSLGSLFF